MTEFQKLKSYIDYVIDTKCQDYDLKFHNLESKVIPANHIYRNDLLRQPGVKVYKVLGVITQPILKTMFPILTFEEFCNKYIE